MIFSVAWYSLSVVFSQIALSVNTATRILCIIMLTKNIASSIFIQRAIGAAVAQFVYTEKVVGSIPTSPTKAFYPLRGLFFIGFDNSSNLSKIIF